MQDPLLHRGHAYFSDVETEARESGPLLHAPAICSRRSVPSIMCQASGVSHTGFQTGADRQAANLKSGTHSSVHTRVSTGTWATAPGRDGACLHSSSQRQEEGDSPSARYSVRRTWDQSWLGPLTSLCGLGPVTHLGWASVSSSVKCVGGSPRDRAGWTPLSCLVVRCGLLPSPPSVVMRQSVQAGRPPPSTGPATPYHLRPSLGSRVLAVPGPSCPQPSTPACVPLSEPLCSPNPLEPSRTLRE